ncbi:MAG TPA: winged helix-turn-helix domain-containing protein [Deltaproteobacteria bacterium]|nr:winged helix-turn-helix domain-containing protein [Deltaproteobacteria bacterium]
MIQLSAAEARRWLLAAHALDRPLGRGHAGVRALLRHRRCIQLDPLDPIGTNADLVALARIDQLRRGGVYDALLPGHAFEHFAKERCLLPADAFPAYRDQARHTPWWRSTERMKRIDETLVRDVLDEIEARGPLTADELTDRGRIDPLDWSGWKGTPRASTLALQVLWVRCAIVVCGRTRRGKRYDVPSRALPDHHDAPAVGDFGRWALLDRIEAAGLLSRAGGPQWGQLRDLRTTLPDQLIEEGLIEEVQVEGSRRAYLAPAGFRQRPQPELDQRMRILGPLDPLLWDRRLVEQAFGFCYVWEVYKPASQRRWGYYVVPLLHRGHLVGRLEGRVADSPTGPTLQILRLWPEQGTRLDRDALQRALRRHATALGVSFDKSTMP